MKTIYNVYVPIEDQPQADNKAHFQTYDVCNKLFEMNLICKKIEPIYRNGNYCGNNIYFKYNKELKYN